MARNIDALSPLVVVALGESFNWVASSGELGQDGSIEVEGPNPGGGGWPLDSETYTLSTASPSQAANVGTNPSTVGTYPFSCSPVTPTITGTQQLVVINTNSAPCDDVDVLPGGYFVWVNDNLFDVRIAPDPGNAGDWPLDDAVVEVPANGWVVRQIDADATANTSYSLVITDANGNAVCPAAGQPKLSVGGGPMETKSPVASAEQPAAGGAMESNFKIAPSGQPKIIVTG